MTRKEYSAGMVKHSFWFAEFRKIVQLLNAGLSMEEIKELNLEKNIFSAPTAARSVMIFNTVSARVKSLDPKFYLLFDQLDISNQKIVVLLSIMVTDTLFFDFMYEVFRDKAILGIYEISDSDINIFFKNKQVQDDRVAKWKDYTLKRLSYCYKTLLFESGLLDKSTESRNMMTPVIDISLEDTLIELGMKTYIGILTGVR